MTETGEQSGVSSANAPKIRVLVVDDSVVVRRLVTDVLAADPDIEVIGTAANGLIALSRVQQMKPDLITLDVEMPEMDGLETLQHLRKQNPEVRVIMFSTLTERGATVTIDALSHGASDYVTKASNLGSLDASRKALQDDLIPKIKHLVRKGRGLPGLGLGRSSARQGALAGKASGTCVADGGAPKPAWSPRFTPKVLTIGVSTGGPNALGAVFPQFPADFPLPVLIVQHMPPLFTRLLAERLQTLTPLEVREAAEGDEVKPGRILIAPGDFHMVVEPGKGDFRIALNRDEPENSCRPAVDVLFRSVRRCYGEKTIALILTGMGQDGLKGAIELHDAGALIMAQDEASSVVWGMPGYVARAGIARHILPLDRIIPEILQYVRG